MKTRALTSTVFALAVVPLTAQSQSDIELLRSRADAHERKISQLEKELNRLKSFHAEKSVPRAVPVAEAASKSEASKSEVGIYVVKPGDILSRIAYRNKTSVAAIIKENGLKSDRIYVGQKLRIPGATAASASAPVRKSTSPGETRMARKAPAPAATKSAGRHKVRSGETFYSIARQYKVSVNSLMAANPKVRPERLGVGQILVIDGSAKVADRGPAVLTPLASLPEAKSRKKVPGTRAAEYVEEPKKKTRTKEVVRNAPADRKQSSSSRRGAGSAIRTITVHQQMTYGQFASKYGASTSQLNALNGLSLSKNTMLAKGSELYVPKY